MAKPYMEKNLVSLAGEFGVACELCLRGYVASLTLKNYPGVDVFVLNPHNKKQTTVQVKASTDGYFNAPIRLPSDGILIYVSIKPDKTLDYYIIPNNKIKSSRANVLEDYLEGHPNSKPDQPIWLGGEEHFSDCKGRWDLLNLD